MLMCVFVCVRVRVCVCVVGEGGWYHIHYNMWDEITYSFPNFNACTAEVSEEINNATYTLLDMWLLIRAGIKFYQC